MGQCPIVPPSMDYNYDEDRRIDTELNPNKRQGRDGVGEGEEDGVRRFVDRPSSKSTSPLPENPLCSEQIGGDDSCLGVPSLGEFLVPRPCLDDGAGAVASSSYYDEVEESLLNPSDVADALWRQGRADAELLDTLRTYSIDDGELDEDEEEGGDTFECHNAALHRGDYRSPSSKQAAALSMVGTQATTAITDTTLLVANRDKYYAPKARFRARSRAGKGTAATTTARASDDKDEEDWDAGRSHSPNSVALMGVGSFGSEGSFVVEQSRSLSQGRPSSSAHAVGNGKWSKGGLLGSYYGKYRSKTTSTSRASAASGDESDAGGALRRTDQDGRRFYPDGTPYAPSPPPPGACALPLAICVGGVRGACGEGGGACSAADDPTFSTRAGPIAVVSSHGGEPDCTSIVATRSSSLLGEGRNSPTTAASPPTVQPPRPLRSRSPLPDVLRLRLPSAGMVRYYRDDYYRMFPGPTVPEGFASSLVGGGDTSSSISGRRSDSNGGNVSDISSYLPPGLVRAESESTTSTPEHSPKSKKDRPLTTTTMRPIHLEADRQSFLGLTITGSLGLVDRSPAAAFGAPSFDLAGSDGPLDGRKKDPNHYLMLRLGRGSGPLLAVCALKSGGSAGRSGGPPFAVRIYGTRPRCPLQESSATAADLGLLDVAGGSSGGRDRELAGSSTGDGNFSLYAWAELVVNRTFPDHRVLYSVYMSAGEKAGRFEERPRYLGEHSSPGSPEVAFVAATEEGGVGGGGCCLVSPRPSLLSGPEPPGWRWGVRDEGDVVGGGGGGGDLAVAVARGYDPALFLCLSAAVDETVEHGMRQKVAREEMRRRKMRRKRRSPTPKKHSYRVGSANQN